MPDSYDPTATYTTFDEFLKAGLCSNKYEAEAIWEYWRTPKSLGSTVDSAPPHSRYSLQEFQEDLKNKGLNLAPEVSKAIWEEAQPAAPKVTSESPIGFVGKAFALIVSASLLLFGAYVIWTIAWFCFFVLASFFGFERQSEQRDRQEMYAYVKAHERAFCRREHIPSAYCSKVFEDSAAYHATIRGWIEVQKVRYKERENSSSFWIFPDFIRDPLVRRR